MKKIYAGILSIVAVLVVVGASAYALFSSQVTVTGVVLGTATTGLNIDAYGRFHGLSSPKTWHGSTTSIGMNDSWMTSRLYPGQSDWAHIKLTNNSSDPMPLKLTGRLSYAGTGWSENSLKDVMLMRVNPVVDESSTSPISYGETHTLAEWNSAERELPGGNLAAGTSQQYWVEFILHTNVDQTIAGKEIRDVEFTITGTQAN